MLVRNRSTNKSLVLCGNWYRNYAGTECLGTSDFTMMALDPLSLLYQTVVKVASSKTKEPTAYLSHFVLSFRFRKVEDIAHYHIANDASQPY